MLPCPSDVQKLSLADYESVSSAGIGSGVVLLTEISERREVILSALVPGSLGDSSDKNLGDLRVQVIDHGSLNLSQ